MDMNLSDVPAIGWKSSGSPTGRATKSYSTLAATCPALLSETAPTTAQALAKAPQRRFRSAFRLLILSPHRSGRVGSALMLGLDDRCRDEFSLSDTNRHRPSRARCQ